jgi:hypothetical protein
VPVQPGFSSSSTSFGCCPDIRLIRDNRGQAHSMPTGEANNTAKRKAIPCVRSTLRPESRILSLPVTHWNFEVCNYRTSQASHLYQRHIKFLACETALFKGGAKVRDPSPFVMQCADQLGQCERDFGDSVVACCQARAPLYSLKPVLCSASVLNLSMSQKKLCTTTGQTIEVAGGYRHNSPQKRDHMALKHCQ